MFGDNGDELEYGDNGDESAYGDNGGVSGLNHNVISIGTTGDDNNKRPQLTKEQKCLIIISKKRIEWSPRSPDLNPWDYSCGDVSKVEFTSQVQRHLMSFGYKLRSPVLIWISKGSGIIEKTGRIGCQIVRESI